MKKVLLSSALFLISFIGFSQTKGISYQAVIIDPNPIEIPGKDVTAQPYVSKDVWIRFGIYAGTTLQYEELHKTKTDEYGLVNLIIGAGVNTGKAGTFTSLSWDGITKSIITNVSFDQGGRYTEVSNQKLNYVPYTLLAETAVKLAGVLPIASGGTGATNAIAARTNLGLGNVDNTADADKPVSIATLAILDTKEAIANKSTNIIADSASSVKYPSVKAIKDYVDSRTSSANNANLAAKATALATPRTINGVAFDGTANITIPVGVTPADADSTTKGILQLAGDLSGTAASPRIKDGAITNAKITSVAGSKVTGDIAGNAATATLAATAITASSAISATTATKLTTARTINGTPFDGTSDITITTNASTLSGTIGILNGGTGASTAAGARTNLGLVIGTDVLAQRTFGTAANSAATDFVAATEKGANNGVATLGNNGKIPSTQIPAISFQNVNVVNSDAAMIGIAGAQVGSIAIRTDNNNNYVLSALPASTLSNWIALATPLYVSTVNGYAGPNVVLTTNDVAEGTTNKYFTDARVRNAISATAPLNFNTTSGVLSMTAASGSSDGYLSSADFTRFNNKQTALTAGVDYATPSGNITGNAANVTGIVSIANGGTGTSTAAGALVALGAEPSDNKSNDILLDGASTTKFPTFKAIKDYVDQQSANAGVADNSITSAKINGTLAVLKGGTGASTAAGARTNLGLVIGTDVMAANATTALTGDVTGSGNGSFATTVNSVGGVSSSTIATLPGLITANTNAIAANTSSITANTNSIATLNTNVAANTASITANSTDIATINTNLALKAPLASPAFTGTPTAPTPATNDNSTKVATTEYVKNSIVAANAGLSSIGAISATSNAKGATISGTTELILTPADATNGGVVTNGAQTFAGAKTFSNDMTVREILFGYGTHNKTNNIAIGRLALNNNTSDYNVAIGNSANSQAASTSGGYNVALGYQAMRFPNSRYNVAIGSQSFYSSAAPSSGDNNVAVGYQAFYNPGTGANNTVLGFQSLYNGGANNSILGAKALYNAAGASNNVAVGDNAGLLFGSGSGTALTSSTQSIFIGSGVRAGTNTSTNEIAIGYNVVGNGSNTVTIGNYSNTANYFRGDINLTGNVNGGTWSGTTIGSNYGGAGTVNGIMKADGAGVVTAIDPAPSTGQFLTSATGGTYTWTAASSVTGVPYTGATQAVDLGAYDLKVNGLTIGRGKLSEISNTGVGIEVLNSVNNSSGGTALTAVGYRALKFNTSGNQNSAFGYMSLYFNNTGGANSSLGSYSLFSNTTGGNNSAFGAQSLYSNSTGQLNSALGSLALYNNNYGSRNTAIGYKSLYSTASSSSAGTDGNYNTALGFMSGNANTTGSNNTFLGYSADAATASLTNATAIGNGAIVNASNTVQIGNYSVTSVVTSGTISATGFTGPLTGNASSATKLAATKNINGIAFDGSADITIAADANTLTGTTLASNVTASSLASVGTITSGIWSATTIDIAKGGTGATTAADARTNLGLVIGTDVMSANATTTLTGDVTGAGNGSFATTLAASGVSSGTYGSSTAIPVLTVDIKGRVTSASTVGIIAGVNSLNYTSTSSYASGGTISGTSLTLAAADATNPGLISTGAQTIAGAKTFSSDVTATNFLGNATTAAKLAATKNINGVAFDGSADITIAADANTLTGTTLASNVINSSLTSVGTITQGVWSATAIPFNKLNITQNDILNLGIPSNADITTYTAGTGLNLTGSTFSVASNVLTSNYQGSAIINGTLTASNSVITGTITANAFVGDGSGLSNVTATKLTSPININGVAFDGSADITIAADANTLTGTTLASNVVNSSLTSVGTITSGVWSGTAITIAKGGTGATTKTAAFDALSPMTTSGDIIYGGSSGTGTRLAKGTDGQVLTLASGIPSWSTLSAVTTLGTFTTTTTYANGGTISGSTLTLGAADGTNPGLVSTLAQTIAGSKTFSSDIITNEVRVGKGVAGNTSNTVLGKSALTATSTVTNQNILNTAIGISAMQNASGTGSYNTAVGANSGFWNSSGSDNTNLGYQSGYNTTTGSKNVAIGSKAMLGVDGSYLTGSGNNAIGFEAMKDISTTAADNIAIGLSAGTKLTTGTKNIFIGSLAGSNISTGSTANTTGLNSVMIGYDVRPLANADNNEIVLSGYNGTAGTVGWGSNSTTIGSLTTTKTRIYGALTTVPAAAVSTSMVAGESSTIEAQGTTGGGTPGSVTLKAGSASAAANGGNINISAGNGAASMTGGNINLTPGTGAVTGSVNVIGADLLIYDNSFRVGKGKGFLSANTVLGNNALNSNTSGNSNTAIGSGTLYNNTSGESNTAVGSSALTANTTGGSNTALGQNALKKNTTGADNVAIGSNALGNNTTGNYNIGIGSLANGEVSSANSNNIGIGWYSLRYNNADRNIGIGYAAGGGLGYNSSTAGANNIFLGFSAGYSAGSASTINTTGTNSVLIGYDVRPNAIGETNEIVISGYNGTAGTVGQGSHSTSIGNSSTTRAVIYGSTSLSNLSPTASSGNGGDFTLEAQDGFASGNTNGGNINLTPGNSNGTGTPGKVNINSVINVAAGTATASVNGLSSAITAQNGGTGNTNGGNINLTPGTATGTGTAGVVQINGQVKITGGSPGAGEVLMSDANGLATWSYSIGSTVVTSTTTYAITLAEAYVFYTGSAAGTFSIPDPASTNAGKEITIKNKTAFGITITPTSTGKIYIDSANTAVNSVAIGIEASNNWIKLVSDGTQWNVIRALF